MLRPLGLALAALFVAVSCVATPTPTPDANGAVPDMTDALAKNPIPVADLFDLTRRLRGRDGQDRCWCRVFR